jgi:phage gp36-like protein
MTIISYLVRADLAQFIDESQVLRLTDDNNLGQINEQVVSEIIASASATIDGYLAKRYKLPLLQSCSQLKEWAGAIVRHELHMRRPDGSDDLPKAVVRSYDNAMKSLREVRDCKLDLTVVDSSEATSEPVIRRAKAKVRTKPRAGRDKLMALHPSNER